MRGRAKDKSLVARLRSKSGVREAFQVHWVLLIAASILAARKLAQFNHFTVRSEEQSSRHKLCADVPLCRLDNRFYGSHELMKTLIAVRCPSTSQPCIEACAHP
jgi:hypothetical protein